MTERPRYDGLGITMLGLVALMLTGLAVVGFIRAPAAIDDSGVQQSMAWANWAMVVVSIAGGVIGALSLYLIYRTLQAAQRSAFAAELALNQAVASAAETEKMGRAQVRAYLIVSSATLNIDSIGNIQVRYGFQNAGETPALDVACTVSIRFDALAPENTWRLLGQRYPETKRRSDIGPGDTRSGKTELVNSDVIAGEDVIWKQTNRVVVAIKLSYADVFEERLGKPVHYGIYFDGLTPGEHTLYRQTRTDGRMDFDVFE